MKTTAYSVGISDLIADEKTNESIAEVITSKKRDVQTLIDQTHLGIFENKTGIKVVFNMQYKAVAIYTFGLGVGLK